MPTPSEPILRGEWTPQSTSPRRSIFDNYRTDATPHLQCQLSVDPTDGISSLPDSHKGAGAQPSLPPGAGRGEDSLTHESTLQSAIDQAMARAFVYRWLAQAFADPRTDGWEWLCATETRISLVNAAQQIPIEAGILPTPRLEEFDDFHLAYVAAFGHAARGSCPLNEIEYGDLKADPLFQPHRLADLVGYYRAFGLTVGDDAGERQDHLCLELEFLCVMAMKEAFALEHQLDVDQLAQGREAQKSFLREHLGRWTPAFARRLSASTRHPTLKALADFLRVFVEHECRRFSVSSGSEDLLLRPVDEAAESLCTSCGLTNLPPGALASAT